MIIVSRIDGNRVVLGIEAPGDVKILRSELLDPPKETESTEGQVTQ